MAQVANSSNKKQRFRDVKKGKISKQVKKERVKSSAPLVTNGQKAKAAVTDSFMLFMPILYIVMYAVMGGREGFQEHMLQGWIYALVPFIVVQTLFMVFGGGQTPGYRAYNLKVVDANSLETAPVFSIIFRNLAMILSILTIFGWLMIFIRKDKKGLHDILSNTTLTIKK